MNDKIEKLRSKLSNDLTVNDQTESPLDRLNEASKIIDEAITALKSMVEDYQFKTEDEEIDFFKRVKPDLLSLKMEQGLRYNLLVNKPIGTTEIQIQYFDDVLKALQNFFHMNTFHYQYYKNGFVNLDTSYFLRSSGPLPVPMPDIPEPVVEFSTPMSYLYAKFIAYEHMQYYILEQIALLKHPELNLQLRSSVPAGDLKWTGDSINLVELAYGLWLTGQFNNGNASLNQIVRWLEENFHVSIGIVQRRFSEIARRKRLSLTKFIDHMRDSILKKIDNDNG
jgi:hypothetical protein